MYFLTILYHYSPLKVIFNELLEAVPALMAGTGVWMLSQIGLCVWNIALYGGKDPRYTNFLISFVHTMYANVALSEQNES